MMIKQRNEKSKPFIRKAVPGEEAAIHLAHMRSIREICVKDHGEEEVKGWGYREQGNRWSGPIKNDLILVVELQKEIKGFGHIRLLEKEGDRFSYIHALYFTPEVVGFGLAKEILFQLIQKAEEWKVDRIELDSSITALGFYKKYGFHENGEKKRVKIGGHPVTAFPMVYPLK